MPRKTKRRGGSKSSTSKSRRSPKGIPMPEHRIEEILKIEADSELFIFPDMTAEERESNARHRKKTLETLRYPRGTDWAKIGHTMGAYRKSLQGMK